ncbi:hypothetical protein ACEPPN_014740 [Leptodophora sp. 'Broadleaf-Isolate-01']
MAHLSSILSDVLNTFYTLKAVERIKLLPIEMLFSILDGFQERLRIFRDDHLCPLCSGSGNGGLDSTGSVVLAFYTIEIVLLRAVLRCLPMNHPGYAGLRGQAKTTLLNVVEFLEKMSPHNSRYRTLVHDHRALPISPPSPFHILRDDEVSEHEDGFTSAGYGGRLAAAIELRAGG